MAARRRRKNITWATDAKKSRKIHPFFQEQQWILNDHSLLQLGSLWTASNDLTPIDLGDKYIPHERKYLGSNYYTGTRIKAGTPAIYMGTLWVQEQKSNEQIVAILRHSFLVDGIPYIVYNLNDFTPDLG